jgi:hypothetical protein
MTLSSLSTIADKMRKTIADIDPNLVNYLVIKIKVTPNELMILDTELLHMTSEGPDVNHKIPDEISVTISGIQFNITKEEQN